MLISGIVFSPSCGKKGNRFQPVSYFPVQLDNTWIFNGELGKMKITNIDDQTATKAVTFTYFDSSDVPLWKEEYKLEENQLYWVTFESKTTLLPVISFNPPLPFAPVSDRQGYKTVLHSTQTHSDTTTNETQIIVAYEIQAVEDVVVPAGKFLNCIKMKIDVQYPQLVRHPLFYGEQIFWYAPLVGPVKYVLPSSRGELVKMSVNSGRIISMDADQ